MEKVSNLYVTTDDGSYKRKGMVTDVIRSGGESEKGIRSGGCHRTMIMMKFVCLLTKELGIHTIVSMNPIMVDGTGMCGRLPSDCGG